MNWSDVGGWIKENAGTGAALVGSLLTGNVPGAVAAGVSLVSGATGSDDPSKALATLKSNPESIVKLKELAYKNEESIRKHLEEMIRIDLEELQVRTKDTQNARLAHKDSKAPVVVSTIVVSGFVAAIYSILSGSIPEGNENLMFLLLGTLAAGFTQVLNFWLGSSHGSKEKTKTLQAFSSK